MEMIEDEKEISSQTWGKMVKSLHQEGFREGSSAGRDETFQSGFDAGYQYGFEIGYKLGLDNGIIKFLSSDSSNLDSEHKEQLSTIKSHEHPSKGLCVMCEIEQQKDSNTESDSTSNESAVEQLSDIMELQKKTVRDNEHLFCTENYITVLKSVKLNNLFEDR